MIQYVKVLLHLGNNSKLKFRYMAYYACADSERYYDCEGATIAIKVGPSQPLIFAIYL